MFCEGCLISRTLAHCCFAKGVLVAKHLHNILQRVFQQQNTYTLLSYCVVFGVSAAEHLILLSYCFVFGVSAAKHTLLSYCFAFGVSATEHLHITSILLCIWCFSNRTLTHYFHIALCLVFQQQNIKAATPLRVWFFSSKTLCVPVFVCVFCF